MSSLLDKETAVLAPSDIQTLKKAFLEEIAELLAAGKRNFIVELDGLGVVDSATISSLIAALRVIRDAGATIALVTGQARVRQTLSITALDRIFPVATNVAEAERSLRDRDRRPNVPPHAPSKKAGKAVKALISVCAMVATFATAPRAIAQSDPAPAAIVAHIIEQNPNLRTYQAHVHVDIKMRTFPFLIPRLEGTTYFKRPDNYEVVFTHVPAYAKGFERVYSDIGDPTSWDRRFVMTPAGERQIAGHRDLALRLVQRVRGMIDHELVFVDPASWRIDAMEWHYYNGGTISMTQQYRDEGGYSVISRQQATIAIPYVKATATAAYSDYRTNVAIDPAVFTKTHE